MSWYPKLYASINVNTLYVNEIFALQIGQPTSAFSKGLSFDSWEAFIPSKKNNNMIYLIIEYY
jgi:hypothetical protein